MSTRRRALPATEPQRMLTFPRLDGGLDLQELDYRVETHRSPNMKNLWWQDGVLQCRDGQRLLWQPQTPEQGFACWQEPFRDRIIYHAGDCLYAAEMKDFSVEPEKLLTGVPKNKGTFFRYGAHLYYKNRGGFYRMGGVPLTAENMEELAYVPTVLLNRDPLDPESGDTYQPPNRLTELRKVCFNAREGVKEYRLPEASEVRTVTVDGAVQTEGWRFVNGCVEFDQAPPVQAPSLNNTVEVVFSVPDPQGKTDLMDTCYAAVFGGGQDLCILLSGSSFQPGTVFWNGAGENAMEPAYWPKEHFVTVGDGGDAVTGFGRQYSDLLVLKEQSLWRLDMDVQQLEGRSTPYFAAFPLSYLAGCDLPGTMALIENNQVFCNRKKGVFQVRSSSAAYETNIRCISGRIHGGQVRGLLRDLRSAERVAGFDDGSRYWVCIDDRVYLWDYSISDFADPSWFYLEGISPVAFFRDAKGRLCHLDAAGRLSLFERSFADYGNAIEKSYQFPTLNFGTYDRRKHVDSVVLSLRADANTDVTVHYDADGMSRTDPLPAWCRAWKLSPRDLRYRCLRLSPFAFTFCRRPCLRRVQHFSMSLHNNEKGSDLAIVSAQVLFRFAEREK